MSICKHTNPIKDKGGYHCADCGENIENHPQRLRNLKGRDLLKYA